jgi:hypothetical protein
MHILLWIIVTVVMLALPHLVNLHSTLVWLRYIHILAVGKWCSVLCICVYWCSSEVSRAHEITYMQQRLKTHTIGWPSWKAVSS